MFHRPADIERERALWQAAEGVVTDQPSWEMGPSEGTDPGGSSPGSAPARFYVHGVIGGWRMDAAKFVQAVHAVDPAQSINLYLNTPGGFVHDAVSMYEALDAHPAGVDVHIGGMAASAGSLLAMVGRTVTISRAGRMMVHDARTIAYGDPAELRAVAEQGDAVSNDIAAVYADRAGGTVASWRAKMQATTWFSAKQAVEAKLADRITGPARRGDTSRASQLVRVRARVALGGV